MAEAKGTPSIETFDRYPILFRMLFLLLSLPLLTLVGLHLYYLINAGTTEGYYKASESRLYLSESIRGATPLENKVGMFGLPQDDEEKPRQGDLIVAIEGTRLDSEAQMLALLEKSAGKDSLVLDIQRPDRPDHFLRFSVPPGRLRQTSIWETPPTLYVWKVPRGGAADEAGMKPGDLIFEIDGETFDNREQAQQMMAATLRGQTIFFGILREGQIRKVTVTLASLTVPLPLIFYQLAGALWLMAAWFLGMFRAHLKAARLLAAGMFLVGVACMLSENSPEVTALPFYRLPRLISSFALFAGVAVLAHASYHFPRENPRLLRFALARYHTYALALAASLWVWREGTSWLPAGLLLVVLPQVVIRLLMDRQRGKERAHMERYLIAGLGFGICAILAWSSLRATMSLSWDLTVRGTTGLVVLAAYVLTITRYRLLGIEIRRNLQYSISIVLWYLLLLSAFAAGLEALSHQELNVLNISLTPSDIEFHEQAFSPEQQERNQRMTLMLLAVILALLLFKIGFIGRIILRKKFHRGTYDYLSAGDEISRTLDSSLSLEQLAQNIAERLCRLMMLKGTAVVLFREQRNPCAFAAQGLKVPGSLRRAFEQDAASLTKCLKRFASELSTDYLPGFLKDATARQQLRYVYPIYNGETLLGAIFTGEKLSESAYRPKDFRFLANTAHHAAVSLDNALLYEQLSHQERIRHELELARHIQLSSLPQEEPRIEGLDISGISLPAFEVGGDYYAYFTENQNRLSLIVGDVSGKGTSAALYMSKMQGIFASLAEYHYSPRELFLKANPVLYREIDAKAFISAIAATIDTQQQTITFARAGHLPLFQYQAEEGHTRAIIPSGLGLGIENRGVLARVLEERTLPIKSGDIYLFLTDGLTEMTNPDKSLFGEERILKRLDEMAQHSARQIRDLLLAEVEAFASGNEARDDQTLVVVKVI